MASLSPEKTIDIVLKAIRELLEYELAVVLSCDGNERMRVRKAAGPMVSHKLDGYTFSLTHRTDIAAIIKRKEPYLFREDESHVDTYADVVAFPDGHSCMLAPLYLEDRLLGMMTLDHRACNMFTPQIVQLVGTLSTLVSLAIVQADENELLNHDRQAIIQERNNLLVNATGVLGELIGDSEPWRRVKDNISLVAASGMPVMINGETGTGKEEVAKAIHKLSTRSGAPFIAVNCSAISTGVAESELFGHEKGSFTGAISQRKGRFEMADGGTLFLDEIGDLPLEIQPKLLRVLQERKLERLGGESSIDVDVRVVAATHVDLKNAVNKRRFREDLYYRLNVFPINLPPLKERGNDVLKLAEFFISRIHARGTYPSLSLAPDSVEVLLNSSWPGNVRQLQNAIERASILCQGKQIRRDHLVTGGAFQNSEDSSPSSMGNETVDILKLDDVIRTHLRRVVDSTGGKIYGTGGAAEMLGLKPTTLQSKLKKYNM